MRLPVEEYHTTTFTFKEKSLLVLENFFLNKDFYKQNPDHILFISWIHGKVKEYQKSHLDILEVCTVSVFFNLTVEYGLTLKQP